MYNPEVRRCDRVHLLPPSCFRFLSSATNPPVFPSLSLLRHPLPLRSLCHSPWWTLMSSFPASRTRSVSGARVLSTISPRTSSAQCRTRMVRNQRPLPPFAPCLSMQCTERPHRSFSVSPPSPAQAWLRWRRLLRRCFGSIPSALLTTVQSSLTRASRPRDPRPHPPLTARLRLPPLLLRLVLRPPQQPAPALPRLPKCPQPRRASLAPTAVDLAPPRPRPRPPRQRAGRSSPRPRPRLQRALPPHPRVYLWQVCCGRRTCVGLDWPRSLPAPPCSASTRSSVARTACDPPPRRPPATCRRPPRSTRHRLWS